MLIYTFLQNVPVLPLELLDYIATILIHDRCFASCANLNVCSRDTHVGTLSTLFKIVHIDVDRYEDLLHPKIWPKLTSSSEWRVIRCESLCSVVTCFVESSDRCNSATRFLVVTSKTCLQAQRRHADIATSLALFRGFETSGHPFLREDDLGGRLVQNKFCYIFLQPAYDFLSGQDAVEMWWILKNAKGTIRCILKPLYITRPSVCNSKETGNIIRYTQSRP